MIMQGIDNTGHPAQVSVCEGGFKQVDEYCVAIHDGNLYRAGFQKNVSSGGTMHLAITTPASPNLHFTPQVSVEGEAQVVFIEAPDSITGGSAVTPLNANRTSVQTSGAVVVSDPTYTLGAGVTLGNVVVGNGRQTGGTVAPDGEWILKPSTDYIMVVTDQSSSANEITIRWYWVEKE